MPTLFQSFNKFNVSHDSAKATVSKASSELAIKTGSLKKRLKLASIEYDFLCKNLKNSNGLKKLSGKNFSLFTSFQSLSEATVLTSRLKLRSFFG